MKWIRTGTALLLSATAVSCARDGAEVAGPMVRDSAGVRIVENGDVATAGWRTEPEPLFTIGWDDGDPTFTWLQSGRILPDGGALVGDFTAGMIYRIGDDGSVVETWGRKGEGPGEYQALDAILLRGDSVLVSDGRLGRLTFLSPDGAVRTASMAGALGHAASAVLNDSRLLLVPGDGYTGVAETRAEWVFEAQPILAVHPEVGSVDTLANLPHLRRWYGTRGAPPGPVHVRGRAGGFSDGFAWARSDQREVRWYDGTGRLTQVSRWEEEPVPLTRDMSDRMLRFYERSYRSISSEESFVTTQVAELQALLDQYQGPVPYWGSMKVDYLGNVWLSAYTLPGEPRISGWRVFARDGTTVGWIELPELVAILDITTDRILAVVQNELDVPAVVMFDLIKP